MLKQQTEIMTVNTASINNFSQSDIQCILNVAGTLVASTFAQPGISTC